MYSPRLPVRFRYLRMRNLTESLETYYKTSLQYIATSNLATTSIRRLACLLRGVNPLHSQNMSRVSLLTFLSFGLNTITDISSSPANKPSFQPRWAIRPKC